MTDQSDDCVLIQEHTNSAGFVVGHAMLNVEATLNSLSLEMIRRLVPALTAWLTPWVTKSFTEKSDKTP